MNCLELDDTWSFRSPPPSRHHSAPRLSRRNVGLGLRCLGRRRRIRRLRQRCKAQRLAPHPVKALGKGARLASAPICAPPPLPPQTEATGAGPQPPRRPCLPRADSAVWTRQRFSPPNLNWQLLRARRQRHWLHHWRGQRWA